MSDTNAQHYSDNDIQRLKDVINEGVQLKHEIDTLSGGLRDTVKAIAEEVGIKPTQLNKAINICYKNSLSEEQGKFDEVVDIIQAVGRG